MRGDTYNGGITSPVFINATFALVIVGFITEIEYTRVRLVRKVTRTAMRSID